MRCNGWRVLVLVPIAMIKECFGLGRLRPIRNMEVDPVLALVAVARVAKLNCAALPDHNIDGSFVDCCTDFSFHSMV